MRILQITKYYFPSVSFGGPIQCTYNLCRQMVKRGHDVTVYTTDALHISTRARIKEKFQLLNGTKVFYFPNVTRSYGWFMSPGIIRALRENLDSFDVVHLHEYRTFQNLAFKYVGRRKVPYVLSLHGELEFKEESPDSAFLRRLFDRVFGNGLLSGAGRIIALTQLEAEQLVCRAIERRRISIIPNGVDPADFSNLPKKGSLRRMFGLKNEKIVLYLGRICKMKGLDTLIRAFSLLKLEDNPKLVLAGPDSGMQRSLQKLVSDLKLNNRILFTGGLDREQVLAALNDATVTVYGSAQEGFPIVPLESGIMGKPIIVSRHASMSFVEKGEFGFAVDYGDVEQLKESLELVLTNEELAAKLSENGKRFVLENFSWDRIGKDIESVYREVAR